MKLSQFKSGRFTQRYQYKSFEPTYINHEWEIDDRDVICLLSKADKAIGELNAYSTLIPDVDFFIQMHVRKESISSSKIEGTQTNMEEVIQKIENIPSEKRNDWIEVNNYIIAMNKSIEDLENLPLSNRLLKNAHKILLKGARGENKLPGEFRKSQNWIGGSSLSDAYFIPPSPENIDNLMSDLEKFLNNENLQIPHLIKIGIAHYQFETIHPFLDGNGRIGRLLIILYLINSKVLIKPTLYLSDFFEKNRIIYYDNLQIVRINNNLIQWLKFFLNGITITSIKSIETFKKIIKLKEQIDENISQLGRKASNAKKLLLYLYKMPIIEIKDISKLLSIDYSTAKRLIDDLLKLNILKEMTKNKKTKLFIFLDYLKLFM